MEAGGGIRTIEAAKTLLQIGVSRVIIGTKAVERPEFMRELIEELGAEKVVLGVYVKHGLVAVEGWEKVSTSTSTELCAMMKEYAVRHIVYTDISRDETVFGLKRPSVPTSLQ